MTVSADIISVNNQYGHYEIGDEIGKTAIINIDKYTLTFIGGILVEVKENKGE